MTMPKPSERDGPIAEHSVDAGEGGGCHGGAETLRAAAVASGNHELLKRYAEDYPKGPHDQPQSMCPAFGSLRVGLRMRRTAIVLSGSGCCVYGLTFTSHFYGARRSVGYVPFDSETLVSGAFFEDLREAGAQARRSGSLRCRRGDQPLCAVGLRRAAASLAQRDQRRSYPRYRRPRIRRADPCRGQGRARRCHAALCADRGRARPGAGAARRAQRAADRDPSRGDVPGRSGRHRDDARADGSGPRSGRPDPRMARALRCSRLSRRCGHPSALHRERARI